MAQKFVSSEWSVSLPLRWLVRIRGFVGSFPMSYFVSRDVWLFVDLYPFPMELLRVRWNDQNVLCLFSASVVMITNSTGFCPRQNLQFGRGL